MLSLLLRASLTRFWDCFGRSGAMLIGGISPGLVASAAAAMPALLPFHLSCSSHAEIAHKIDKAVCGVASSEDSGNRASHTAADALIWIDPFAIATGEATLPTPAAIADASTLSIEQPVDIDPAIIEGSPVLQRWLEEVPDVAVDIHHDPAFRTRLRLGYAEFPSTDNTGGLYVGVQDIFVGRTPLTVSAEYATNGRGDRQTIGVDAQYYLFPLGWYGNIAPVIGYRDIETSAFETAGINIGLRVILIPSRTGTADLSVTQSWVDPGTSEEVGLTTFAAGYAIAEDLRIGTDIQIQNTRKRQESRVGVLVEWML
ncbi:MAG: hypothetical protein ACFBSG_01285 [Leptolyngbyaceae cyanobacterium]